MVERLAAPSVGYLVASMDDPKAVRLDGSMVEQMVASTADLTAARSDDLTVDCSADPKDDCLAVL